MSDNIHPISVQRYLTITSSLEKDVGRAKSILAIAILRKQISNSSHLDEPTATEVYREGLKSSLEELAAINAKWFDDPTVDKLGIELKGYGALNYLAKMTLKAGIVGGGATLLGLSTPIALLGVCFTIYMDLSNYRDTSLHGLAKNEIRDVQAKLREALNVPVDIDPQNTDSGEVRQPKTIKRM